MAEIPCAWGDRKNSAFKYLVGSGHSRERWRNKKIPTVSASSGCSVAEAQLLHGAAVLLCLWALSLCLSPQLEEYYCCCSPLLGSHSLSRWLTLLPLPPPLSDRSSVAVCKDDDGALLSPELPGWMSSLCLLLLPSLSLEPALRHT